MDEVIEMTERLLFGTYTYAQWMDPARLAAQAQKEWDTQMAMEEAFDLVKNKEHWKGRIDAVIPADKRDVVESAIRHFTGGGARFIAVQEEGKLRVTAPGYWANGF